MQTSARFPWHACPGECQLVDIPWCSVATRQPPGQLAMTTYDVVASVSDRESREVFEVYDAVFGDQPDHDAWRSGIWDRHRVREGFRLARAYDGERLVGFGYGYTGE